MAGKSPSPGPPRSNKSPRSAAGPKAPRADGRPQTPHIKQESARKNLKSGRVIVCDGCKAFYQTGRWHWGAAPVAELHSGLCPACQRIRDRKPAGTICLPSEFLSVRDEVLGMVHNAEKAAKEEHPLERLMDIIDSLEGELLVTTTGIHLARALTNKLERRFHKQARIRFGQNDTLFYADWEGLQPK